MIKLHIIDPDGNEYETQTDIGGNLMTVATDNLIPGIDAECGGSCSCATCHVYINDTKQLQLLGEKSDVENMLLDCLETKRENSRLACQVSLTDKQDGLVVHIAPQM
ncbi:2Fe-2S iron-sulfur cluster-binding protein [Porticoccaceae bacterium]|mgnify:FL=1|nr:2Fe-2S iron-sulfur cluster-binding protein [Porticoccaceae bacterium]MDC0053625.1 2Fe-2S iron-sulfur cluster-binding protein [Gammaproteobacteria bacterium]MDA8878411.1 2Fe-2S iron-sulfur cluster-binding protein [Porticoccaceae bacterium]MDA9583509.1 2Fe-2S iron-sulfur cluster-binding protein [Porticoccaceae bacterium]MDB2395092.1 2Fe-2S iron-sulfur cluster-binding protein [Porticoccaceae bacterium]